MGRMYGRKTRKNNKASRAQKKAWISRSTVQNSSSKNEPMIFDEIPSEFLDDTILNDNEVAQDRLASETTQANELLHVLEGDDSDLEILPNNWASKTYNARYFIQKRTVSVKEVGTISSDEYERINSFPLTVEILGLVEDNSILEVKCIYLKPEVVVNSIEDVINLKKRQLCLQKKGNEITLKRNHSYYYQVQGQLNITNKSKCYFVVYVNDRIELYVEEIYRDNEFWVQKMLPELTTFYNKCIAPEIIRNNIGRGKNCVDPPYILEAIKLHHDKKKEQPK